MKCEDCQLACYDLLDRSLCAKAEREVLAHVESCPRCRSFLEEEGQRMRTWPRLLGVAVRNTVVPPDATERVAHALEVSHRKGFRPYSWPRVSLFRRSVFWAAVAASVLILAGAGAALLRGVPRVSGLRPALSALRSPGADSPVRVTRLWGASGLELPGALPGTVRLGNGLAVVRLESGVELTLLGPLKAEIRDAMQVRLEEGRLLAEVPPRASMFTVLTPELEIWDLGTIFGVSAEAGRSDVFVFKGSVQVNEASGEPVDLCAAGEGVRAVARAAPIKINTDWAESMRLFGGVRGGAALKSPAEALKTAGRIADLWVERYMPGANLLSKKGVAGDGTTFKKTVWERTAVLSQEEQEVEKMNKASMGAVLAAASVIVMDAGTATADTLVRWGHVWYSSSNPSVSLNVAGQKNAHTIVPDKALSVSQIAIYGGISKMGSPVYRVGVQEDDGTTSHYPNGVWVGGEANYATTSLPDLSAWSVFTLPAEASLAKGARYHLVIETVSADTSNYGSIVQNNQSPLRTFRVNDGVYDAFMGKELYKNAAWSRISSLPIVAIDTNAVSSVGQPWRTQSTYYGAFYTTRSGQIFTCNAPGSQEGRFLLKAMGMQVTFNGSPADNLRIHLATYPDMTELASSVLVATNNLVAGLIMTNLSADASVILRNGSRYILYCEATNIVKGSADNFKVVDCVGASSQFVGAASATFQGTNAYFATSTDGVTWTKQFQNTADDDLVFELWLEPKPVSGTMISVR